MNALEMANFAVAWAGAATAWVGAISSSKASGSDPRRVVANDVATVGTAPAVDFVNVGGRGAVDVEVHVDDVAVAFTGGLAPGGGWTVPLPSATDGSIVVLTSLDARGRSASERYVLRLDGGVWRLSR